MKGVKSLDQAAHDIIAEGRYALDPGSVVRERVQRRVLLRLGPRRPLCSRRTACWLAPQSGF